MSQKKTITIKNFWNFTFGVFEDVTDTIDFIYEGYGYIKIAESEDGSKYYIHYSQKELPLEVIRISNHWGGGIGTCNWYLQGKKVCNSYKFKEIYENELFAGKIKLKNLQRMIPANVGWSEDYGNVDEDDCTNRDPDYDLSCTSNHTDFDLCKKYENYYKNN